MKIEILTTPKTVESVNYILKMAINTLMKNEEIVKEMGLTKDDVIIADGFRKRLVYLANSDTRKTNLNVKVLCARFNGAKHVLQAVGF